MKNIYILPTDKPSKIWFYKQFENLLTGLTVEKSKDIHPQHIYITSNEKIKKLDWYIADNKLYRASVDHMPELYTYPCKKIILTTDQDLIANGVQAIDDEFLEWFVKNSSCEEVVVERLLQIGNLTQLGEIFDITESWKFKGRTLYYCGESKTKGIWKLEEELTVDKFNNTYKIIIPQEEPKQSVQEYEQQCLEKYSQEICPICETTVLVGGDCKKCTDDLCKPFRIKQETLEEAFSNYINERHSPIKGSTPDLASAKFGVKWQAERMYSKEEVRLMLSESFKASQEGYNISSDEIIEQFKKK